MGSFFCCHCKDEGDDKDEIEHVKPAGQCGSIRSQIDLDYSLSRQINERNSVSEHNMSLYGLDMGVNKVIKAQALVKGYLRRSKFKNKKACIRFDNHIGNLENNPDENPFSNLKGLNPIRQLYEVPVDMYVSYFNSEVASLRYKLGDFVYKNTEKYYKSVKENRNYIIMEDESIYSGEFNMIYERYGYGTCIKKTGSFYEGFWDKDKQNGKGRLIHSNCKVYEGEWLDNVAHGNGFYIDTNDNRYEGDWEYGLKNGNGIEISSDGAKYSGSFVNGQKHGLGKLEMTDGSAYEGEFIDGLYNGNGTLIWKEGKKIGRWENNMMNGKGVMIWNDGRSYEGDIVKDTIHGFGIFIWPDKRKYEGFWVNGKKDGKSYYTTAGGLRVMKCKDGKMIKIANADNKN